MSEVRQGQEVYVVISKVRNAEEMKVFLDKHDAELYVGKAMMNGYPCQVGKAEVYVKDRNND